MIGWPSQVTRAVLVSSRSGPHSISLLAWPEARRTWARTRASSSSMWKGLATIVVGAGVDAGDLVAPAVAGGEDDDRHLALGAAPLLEHADAVHLRQADVEDDDVVGLGLAEEVALLAVEGGVDGVAGIRQRGDELAVEIAVILYDKDAHFPSLGCHGSSRI